MKGFYQLDQYEQEKRLQSLGSKALAFWGLEEADLSLIKYRENAVYEVRLKDGRKYALRIHRPGYQTDKALNSELLWLGALAESNILVPEVIPSLTGELSIVVQIEEVPEARQVDLFAWVEGKQIGSIEAGLGQNMAEIDCMFTFLGELAAKLHNQSSRWPLPEGFERHAWDQAGLVGEQPFWGRFWELALLTQEQKTLLIEVREKLEKDLSHLDKKQNNYGLIHADFVPENLINDAGKVRLIDFDDAGFGWHMFELATALYFIREEEIYPVAKAALFAGYRKYRNLSEAEESKLDLFLTARAMTYLGWIRTRQETSTARDMAPKLIRLACNQALRYLNKG